MPPDGFEEIGLDICDVTLSTSEPCWDFKLDVLFLRRSILESSHLNCFQLVGIWLDRRVSSEEKDLATV